MPSNPVSGQAMPVRPGAPIRALDYNRLGDSAWQNLGVFPAPFSYGGRFPGGTVAIPIVSGSGGSSNAVTIFPPWYPFTTQTGGGAYQANFYAGTIGGILPTNMFTPVALTAASVNYVYAQVTAAGGVVTAVTIAASTVYPSTVTPVSGSAPTSFNIPLAIFDLTGAKPVLYNIVGFGNIWCSPIVTLQTTLATGGLLSAPFTPTYSWTWGAGN